MSQADAQTPTTPASSEASPYRGRVVEYSEQPGTEEKEVTTVEEVGFDEVNELIAWLRARINEGKRILFQVPPRQRPAVLRALRSK